MKYSNTYITIEKKQVKQVNKTTALKMFTVPVMHAQNYHSTQKISCFWAGGGRWNS